MALNEELFGMLRTRYPAGQYSILQEVRDEAGFQASRSLDIMCMGLWPSRGCELHGIEMKRSRVDWLKELKNPMKQESIFQYCDRFWLLAIEDKVVLDIAEIPKTWGYMQVKGKRIVVVKEAPVLKPKPITRSFLAAMMKRATEGMIPASSVKDKLNTEFIRGKDAKTSELKHQIERIAEMEKAIADFESASGVTIYNDWRSLDQKNIGAAVRAVIEGDKRVEKIKRELRDLRNPIDRLLKAVDDELNSFIENPASVTEHS